MKTYIALVKREFLEHRGAFFDRASRDHLYRHYYICYWHYAGSKRYRS